MLIRLQIIVLLMVVPLFGQSRYVIKTDERLINESYKILISQVGKRETGNNRGIADQYNASIGNPMGSPYCQAGLYWCYMKACENLKLPQKLIPMPRNGMAISTYTNAQKNGVKTKYEAKMDDFIVWKSYKNNTGHIERIVGVGRAGWVTTVGFNTGGGSEDNGEGVAYKKRNINMPLNRIKKIKGLTGVR